MKVAFSALANHQFCAIFRVDRLRRFRSALAKSRSLDGYKSNAVDVMDHLRPKRRKKNVKWEIALAQGSNKRYTLWSRRDFSSTRFGTRSKRHTTTNESEAKKEKKMIGKKSVCGWEWVRYGMRIKVDWCNDFVCWKYAFDTIFDLASAWFLLHPLLPHII